MEKRQKPLQAGFAELPEMARAQRAPGNLRVPETQNSFPLFEERRKTKSQLSFITVSSSTYSWLRKVTVG